MKRHISNLALTTVFACTVTSYVGAANATLPPLFEEVFSYSLGNFWCENHLSVADMNGDGRKDIVLMVTGLTDTNGPPWRYQCRALLLQARPEGGFSDFIITNFSGRYGYGAFAADLNNDGTSDLILREQSGTHVLLNDGSGSFEEVWTGQPGYYNLATVDVNRDGFLDFVSGTQTGTGGLLELFINDGTGRSFRKTWQSRFYGSGYDSIQTVLKVNLNGDGLPDIAAREIYGGRLVTLLGTNSGDRFIERDEMYLGDRTFALAAGRVNGDALDDLALYVGWGSVRVFTNGGDGSMLSYWESPSLGQAAFNLALADFDGDGLDDIFVGTFADGRLRVFRNDGRTGFSPWWESSIPGQGYTGVVADLNGDGWPDLLLSEQNKRTSASNLRVWLNRTGATWITGIEPGPDGTVVSWTARPGKLYQLQSTTNGLGSEWLDIDEPITALGTNITTIDRGSFNLGHCFYRVRVME
jgi:hypothetical protein